MSSLGLVTALGSKNRPQPVQRGIACQEITVDILVFLCKGNGVREKAGSSDNVLGVGEFPNDASGIACSDHVTG